MKEKISLISLGCSKNLVDSEMLIGGLMSENYEIIKDPQQSDTVIINTCGFLDIARQESVDTILECTDLKNEGIIKQLIVMGCLSNRYGTELHKKIPEVDFIIYCIKSKNIKTSNTYFNKFVKILKKLSNKPKILFISSGAVYGKNKFKRKNIENEKLNIKTINSLTGYKKEYAKEKIFIEEKIKQLGYQNYKVAIARCYTFIGKNILRYKYAASDLINDGFYKSKIKLNTKIDVYRSYMHSDDLVKWLIVILKNSSENCPIYNVGSDEAVSLHALAKLIGKILKKPLKIGKIGSKKIDRYIPSIQKAKQELNLRINYNLKHSIYSTIKCNYEKYD